MYLVYMIWTFIKTIDINIYIGIFYAYLDENSNK